MSSRLLKPNLTFVVGCVEQAALLLFVESDAMQEHNHNNNELFFQVSPRPGLYLVHTMSAYARSHLLISSCKK